MFPFYIDEVVCFASQERTARCREDYFFNPVSRFTNQALKYGRMFRESTGITGTLFSTARFITISPATTSVSLFANAMALPAPIAFNVGLRLRETNNACKH